MTAVSVDLGGRTVLREIDLAVEPARLVAVIGPSGCGKTTLLRLLGDLLEPTAGTVAGCRERTAFVFQDHRLLPWRTALANVAFGALSRGVDRRERRAMAERLLFECGLPPESHGLYPAQLSGGMRARVALARALAVEPRLVLLDEPFNGLDLQMRRSLQSMLCALVERRGLGAVLVTHDLLEASRIADRVVAISSSGRIAFLESFERRPAERNGDAIQAAAQRLTLRLESSASGRD
ncbi:ATP-binding cassette domain-containing protein [Algihabitans albus]|uniref:ATP-binding cassette domain-containing protein n=1 Tax=Algihabitans albus TaxID=2164067 RepID=UPI0013C31408|nr:ATP-binding cassette domain-containing protein [Algihabitans albus]